MSKFKIRPGEYFVSYRYMKGEGHVTFIINESVTVVVFLKHVKAFITQKHDVNQYSIVSISRIAY